MSSDDTSNGRANQLGRRAFLEQTTRIAAAACAAGGCFLAPGISRGNDATSSVGRRISYFRNGEIHINEPGQTEGKPITSGHMDFKPSWSKTGDMLVCFRRTKDDPVTANWKSAIFVVNIDGTGFHPLSDGTRTDFNPTWTRDGLNTPIWNRKNDRTGGYCIMQSTVGGKIGAELALTDDGFHNWAHSCLTDGRILVNAAHPSLGWGVYLLTRRADAKPLYERVEWDLNQQGQMHRASVSPSEKRICFEFLVGSKFTEPGHTLYIADFDAATRRISNLKPIANQAGKPIWFAYPRWVDSESAVVYHSSETGKNQLYVYRLDDGSTRRVSADATADYRYPHGEAAPC
jgi:hypothetical protein